MGPAARRPSVIAAAAVLACALGITNGAGVAAQAEAPTSMCLLSVDELNELSGLSFASSDEASGACSYMSDPSVDMYALDLRISTESSLDGIRFQYERGGQETTVAGFPAWSSDDGLFVDVGERLFVVQPIFFLSESATDPVAVQAAVGERATPRVGSAIEAVFGDEDRLTALFPTEFDGFPLFVDVMAGSDFLAYVDLGTAAIEEVLTSQGLTLADLSIATASFGGADVLAIQAPGVDASLLMPAVSEGVARFGGTPTPVQRAGRDLLSYPQMGAWLYTSGDVLWMITQPDETALDALLAVLP